MKNIVRDEVFDLHPDFVRAVVIARDLRIASYNPRIASFLAHAETHRQGEAQELLLHPLVTTWDSVHRSFGSNPNRFPPSIRSLLERIRRGKPLPYINDAVALFNTISLKYLVPSGGDDLDAIVGDIYLGRWR